MRNANDAASRVPNPLFSPLDNVAPAIREKPKGSFNTYSLTLLRFRDKNNVTEITLPTVNSMTTMMGKTITNNIPENAADIISPNLQESMRSNNQRAAIINHQKHK